MTGNLKSFFWRACGVNWRSILLGGAIAVSPMIALADKDDRDKDKSNRNGQAAATKSQSSRANAGSNDRKASSGPERPGRQQTTSGNTSNRIQTGRGVINQGSEKIEGRNNASISRLNGDSKKKLDQKDKDADSKRIRQEQKHNNGAEKKKIELPTRVSPDKDLGQRMDPFPKKKAADNAGKNRDKDRDQNDDKRKDQIKRNDDKDKKSNGKDPKTTVPDFAKGKRPARAVKPSDLAKKNRDKNDDRDEARGGSKRRDEKKTGNFLDQHKKGKFDSLVKGTVAKKLDLGKQFDLKHKGDLTLKLNLHQKIKMHGGWSKSHWAGLIGPGYGAGYSPIVYCGPGYFPSHCLYPGWTPWVEYCWWFRCDPVYDPRPWFCRPWVYDPCPTWVYWEYPVWYELPVATCGTWVDVEPVVVDEGLDLQLLAVRFVDPGQPELREGPRYRVWARNNSTQTILRDFNIMLMAANDRLATEELPQAGMRVDTIEPGEVKAFDIRLPFESIAMDRDAEGNVIPFTQLHVIVDSHREVPEAFEENNGAVIARVDILPVDPVIFGSDSAVPVPGTEINIAGEGFGPEPGQVLVNVGGIELQAEIEGWYDLGVRVKLPSLALAAPTDAEVILVRGDTAASNPLTIQLTMPVAMR